MISLLHFWLVFQIFSFILIVDFLKVYKNQDIYHFDIYKNGFFSIHTRKVVLQGVPHVNSQKSTKEQSGFILDM